MKKLEIVKLNKPGITDFAKERNILLKKAKSEWVLFIDSDEKISKALKKEIKKAVKSKEINGYFIPRKNYFLGRYAGTDNILRLGRRNSGKWERAVHEVWKIKGETGNLNGKIIHNTAGSIEEMVEKINFYSTLHAKANINEGKKSSLIKITLFPIFKFIESILMGRGLLLSVLQSFHSFLSWAKQWELQKD